MERDHDQPEHSFLREDVVAPRLSPKPPPRTLEGANGLTRRDVAEAAQLSNRGQLDSEGPDRVSLRRSTGRSYSLSENLQVALDGVSDVTTDPLERLRLRRAARELGNLGPVPPFLRLVDLDREPTLHGGVHGVDDLSPFPRKAPCLEQEPSAREIFRVVGKGTWTKGPAPSFGSSFRRKYGAFGRRSMTQLCAARGSQSYGQAGTYLRRDEGCAQ